MKCYALVAMGMCIAGSASAQDDQFSVSVGVKAWNMQWTTFSYDVNQGGATVLTQVTAEDKVVFLPVLSARYRNFVASVSGYPSTSFDFVDSNRRNTRSELDVNLGYHVLPGLAVTVGYKKIVQDGEFHYEPKGWVVGLAGSAPLGSAFSLYGALGFGRLKTSYSDDPNVVQFDANYRLSEVGLAYSVPLDRFAKTLTFTAGYRSQVLISKDALGSQDGLDTTQGVTLGFVATF